MRKLLLGAATIVTTVGLTAGVAAAQSGGSISGTGPNSHAHISSHLHASNNVTNRNTLGVTNTNTQSANTGRAEVRNNTTGGDATSGNAMNDAHLAVNASVDNSSAGGGMGGAAVMPADLGGGDGGSISNTGPNSNASISSSAKLTNTVNNSNYLTVTNNSHQTANTGSAQVSNNTTGGSATSGDASNTQSATITLDVTN